jgi:hypothetical protein
MSHPANCAPCRSAPSQQHTAHAAAVHMTPRTLVTIPCRPTLPPIGRRLSVPLLFLLDMNRGLLVATPLLLGRDHHLLTTTLLPRLHHRNLDDPPASTLPIRAGTLRRQLGRTTTSVRSRLNLSLHCVRCTPHAPTLIRSQRLPKRTELPPPRVTILPRPQRPIGRTLLWLWALRATTLLRLLPSRTDKIPSVILVLILVLILVVPSAGIQECFSAVCTPSRTSSARLYVCCTSSACLLLCRTFSVRLLLCRTFSVRLLCCSFQLLALPLSATPPLPPPPPPLKQLHVGSSGVLPHHDKFHLGALLCPLVGGTPKTIGTHPCHLPSTTHQRCIRFLWEVRGCAFAHKPKSTTDSTPLPAFASAHLETREWSVYVCTCVPVRDHVVVAAQSADHEFGR